MNKKELLSIAKNATKEYFTGQNVGRAIDVAEKGVNVVQSGVLWVKILVAVIALLAIGLAGALVVAFI